MLSPQQNTDSVESFQRDFSSMSQVKNFLEEVFKNIAKQEIVIPRGYTDSLRSKSWKQIKLMDKSVSYRFGIFDVPYFSGKTFTSALYEGLNKFFKNGLKDPTETF